MVLFAVCDHDYIFRYVNIGAFGGVNDAGVFSNSSFGKLLTSDVLNIPEPKPLPNTPDSEYPHFFVGDGAFPLQTNLLRPYAELRKRDFYRSEKIFNYRLSRARRVIENAFGILVSRWRIFRKPIVADRHTVELIVKACVCLHNFLKLSAEDSNKYCPPTFIDTENQNHQIIPGDWRREVEDKCAIRRMGRVGANNSPQRIREQRDELAKWLSETEQGSVPWQDTMVNMGGERGFTGE